MAQHAKSNFPPVARNCPLPAQHEGQILRAATFPSAGDDQVRLGKILRIVAKLNWKSTIWVVV